MNITTKNKLKAKMVENGFTLKKLAEKVNLCETTLRKKIDNKSKFTIEESMLFKKELNLTNEEFLDIFFSENMN